MTQAKANSKHLVSITEGSKLFGVGRDKLYQITKSQKDAPVVRVGQCTKINVPMFAEWLDKVTKEGREL